MEDKVFHTNVGVFADIFFIFLRLMNKILIEYFGSVNCGNGVSIFVETS